MKVRQDKVDDYNHFIEINSEDGYSYGVVKYMHWWANMMEVEIAKGKKLEDIAEKTSRDADKEGITGFMYGCAVAALAEFWEYGEELRQWHNSKYGHHGEGVVNPAILTVGEKK